LVNGVSQPISEAVFWQTFLSLDLSNAQVEAFWDQLPPGIDRVAALRSWKMLTSAQRDRLRFVEIDRISAHLNKGIRVRSGDDIGFELEGVHALFTWGDETALQAPSVAIVGTRRASAYGKACARRFASHLASLGVTIVSGGALGIDESAHRGALEAKGRTVVVLPCGVDLCYPPSHAPLFEEVRGGTGCLVSPYPLGKPSLAHQFLERNAIIAALSSVVIVIEAPAQSGALATAIRAAEQGKDVLVVPGAISTETFRGSHQLIRDGATLVYHPEQVLELLDIAPSAAPVAQEFEENQRKILELLDSEPRTAEYLIQQLGIDPNQLLADLTLLEIEAAIIKSPGGYIRAMGADFRS
jgi:DNA processing protein